MSLLENNLTILEEQSACSSDLTMFCVAGLNICV